MKNIPDPIANLKNHTEYNFKASKIEKILDKFAILIEKNKESFDNAIKKDAKSNSQKIEFNKIIQIVNTYKKDMPILPYFSAQKIKDGFGNIAVMYNGDPYVTLKMLISSLRTHNNVVFFTKNFKTLNDLLIESINIVTKELKYTERIAVLQTNFSKNDIIKKQNGFNLLVYIGNKRDFQTVSKQLNIPSVFRGYGSIDVFIDDKSYKETLLDIDDFAYENNIKVNYFHNTDIDETIAYINKYNLNDCFAVFTKNSELAYKFINSIKSKNIFINTNPFVNYEFDLNENQLVYTKNISMKI